MSHGPEPNAFGSRQTLRTATGDKTYYALPRLSEAGVGQVERLPRSIRVLLEAALRQVDGFLVTEDAVRRLANWDPAAGQGEIPYMPGRVILQDFTGVPAVVDLAALRSAAHRFGTDPQKINPQVPCDLVIDHSVQVDAFGSGRALRLNSQREFERNKERYAFLKWGQQAFDNFTVVPPATGIVHQVNLEYLAKGVWEKDGVLYPDSLVGTDSHTTMINGLGVLGWGVGGIEAEAVMLGQPIYMRTPEVVGFKITGTLSEACTATDLVLTVTQMLREHGVVGKFVEFYGPGLAEMPVANRATIANMAPEYGATVGFFPVDEQTLRYLRLTGRDEALIETVEAYCKAQGLWRDDSAPIEYSEQLELDLSDVEPSLAGPKRPQDRVSLGAMAEQWQQDLVDTFGKDGGGESSSGGSWENEGGRMQPATAVAEADPGTEGVEVFAEGQRFHIGHGSVVIAAITSCTNTSNPEVMVAAGLLARNAAARGLSSRPWVKTSLAPGSKVVTEYLRKADLLDDLEALGFHLVGYGCTTCIGNSGPLPEPVSEAIRNHDLVTASVLSGNRNFEGRVHPEVRANYLASPPLVVAYAVAGSVEKDLLNEPLGTDRDGREVYLRDIWPSPVEIQRTIDRCVSRDQFIEQYANVYEGSEEWNQIETTGGALYEWDPDNTYVQEPPFFKTMEREVPSIRPIRGARCLVKVGDSVTTDHISPAGAIGKESPAGQYLMTKGVQPKDFNSYGSRRGNHEVMIRGTFLKPGGGEVTSIYDAAMHYQENGVPLVVLAGEDYGMGSSRDWAAKGTYLLGVRAVLATSFERIHRSNLVGMGVLPLQFEKGQDADTLGLTGRETFDIEVPEDLSPGQALTVVARDENGAERSFTAYARVDTPVDVDYYRHGGILHRVLRRLVNGS